MKLKRLSIISAALMSLLFTSNIFADNQESFVRKVVDGGSVSQLIQTTNGNYVYLGGSKYHNSAEYIRQKHFTSSTLY